MYIILLAVGGNPAADVSVPKPTNGAAQTSKQSHEVKSTAPVQGAEASFVNCTASSIVDSTSKEHVESHPVNGGSQPGSEAIKPGM